jgi:hypothetical protein
MPGHGRAHFFKYSTASTANAILTTSTIRYSSPLLFNDPFDLQTGMPFKFDMNALPERLFAHIEGLVHSASEPAFLDAKGLSSAKIHAARQDSTQAARGSRRYSW